MPELNNFTQAVYILFHVFFSSCLECQAFLLTDKKISFCFDQFNSFYTCIHVVFSEALVTGKQTSITISVCDLNTNHLWCSEKEKHMFYSLKITSLKLVFSHNIVLLQPCFIQSGKYKNCISSSGISVMSTTPDKMNNQNKGCLVIACFLSLKYAAFEPRKCIAKMMMSDEIVSVFR